MIRRQARQYILPVSQEPGVYYCVRHTDRNCAKSRI
jgi:hypothetical protein